MRSAAQQAGMDMDLIERIRRGESVEDDFRSLYDRHAPATYAWFVRRVGDADVAADLNQELFLRLAETIETFEGRCSWRTWVFLIARNVLSAHRNRRFRAVDAHPVSIDADGFVGELRVEVDADEEAADVLLRSRLRRCIRRLSETGRAVILGHYFEGITLREITERLKMTNPSGSRGALIAAQRKLRRCLSERGSS